MDLFLYPKNIETVGKKKKKKDTDLRNKCCILFVLKKGNGWISVLGKRNPVSVVTSASRVQSHQYNWWMQKG